MKGQTSTSALKRFMNKDNTVGHVFAFPFIFGFVCFSLIPVCISFYYAFTNYSLGSKTVMRRKKLCGESFRTDVTSRLFTRNLSIIFYKVFKNAFKSGSSFQSGMAGVFILVSIVSNALRRASGLAFA